MYESLGDVISLARELAQNPFSERLRNDPLFIGRQLLEGALVEGTTGRSLLHAHVPGMHSIMLFDRKDTSLTGRNDGGKIRLFYTEPGAHPLNKFYDPRSNDFNCRPHDHEFPIAIVPLVGDLQHRQTEETLRSHNFPLHKFLFQTAVGSTDGFGLIYQGIQELDTPYDTKIVPGDVLTLNSKDIHSVTAAEIGKQSATAWLVIEGPKEEKNTLLFSTEERPSMDASELYVPATRRDVERIIGNTLFRMERGY
jgi:hypothetical protein